MVVACGRCGSRRTLNQAALAAVRDKLALLTDMKNSFHACACAVFTAWTVAGALAAKPDVSDEFFTNGRIPHIKIEITASNLAQLRRNLRIYVPAVVREGTNEWEDVGIHWKGAAGSNRDLNDHPALSLNFDKFIDDQKFHGLDKFHLNNSVQDGSRMHEAICARLFHEAGVPAARVTQARVSLNGRDLGLYVLKEGFDKTFLRRHFAKANGNLYDGGFLADIDNPGIQRTSGSGDVTPRSELKALVAAANEPDHSNRLARLEQVLDVDRFLTFIALEMMTWHWDGYAMQRNNYRVYHDPTTDKLVFFPHGMDQMFWEPNRPLFEMREIEGLVAQRLLQTTQGRRRYRARVASLLTNVFTAEKFTNHINQLQSRIRPALAAINPDAARNHDSAVTHLRNQILARVRHLENLIAEPEPTPVKFDPSGVALLPPWTRPQPRPEVKFTDTAEIITNASGARLIHFAVGPSNKCVASYRTRVLLPTGRYVFEARARTQGVEQLTETATKTGVGAGIRISKPELPRSNALLGDSDWEKLEYFFEIKAESEEVWMLCELRASAGEAWFELDSLKLRKR